MSFSRDNDLAQQNRDRLRAMLVRRSSEPSSPSSSKRMVISETGGGTPLYCIHGGAAGLADYRRIAGCQDLGRPVFGMQLASASVDDPVLASIDRLAGKHCEKIEQEYPAGPLMLAGHSMAAVVALEVGQLLMARGREVRLVAIIDHAGPDAAITTRDWLYWQWIAMSALPWRQRGRFVWEGVSYRLRRNQRLPRWLRSWFFSNKSKAAKAGAKPSSPAEYRRRMADVSSQALRDYRPQPFGGPMVLFRARSGAPRLHADPLGGWSRISDGKIQVVEIPGHHMNIFQPPHVEVFAKRLVDCLNQHDQEI